MNNQIKRRKFLKIQAGALGGLAVASALNSSALRASTAAAQSPTPTATPTLSPVADPKGQCYTPVTNQLFDSLPIQCPGGVLAEGEMRISFLGTSPIPRRAQEGVSVYIEMGPTHLDPQTGLNVPLDYVMFDCGMGVLANYLAMNIPYSRMDKIFLAHLHADHMSELTAIYAFGESSDRRSPLYVWGQSSSGVPDPVSGQLYDDGLKRTLEHFREWMRWHTESFSFSSNSYKSFPIPTQESWGTPAPLVPIGPKYVTDAQGKPLGPAYADPYGKTPDGKGGEYATYDAYALVPIELDWKKVGGIAYWNKSTGVKITHFPAIHTRKGALSYKLEWTPPGRSETLSLIYSGDTKPNSIMLEQAQGVDVLIHEMVMPPDQWASHSLGVPVNQLTDRQIAYTKAIQNSSHTTQGAFGYMLSQMNPRPRLTVATHFQAQDDTIASAQKSLDAYKIPRDAYTFAADLMMLNVTKDKITPSRADISAFAFGAPPYTYPDPNVPKYHDANGNSDPNAQIDNADWIPYTGYPGLNKVTYNEDGY